jgi:hypothetical protein
VVGELLNDCNKSFAPKVPLFISRAHIPTTCITYGKVAVQFPKGQEQRSLQFYPSFHTPPRAARYHASVKAFDAMFLKDEVGA